MTSNPTPAERAKILLNGLYEGGHGIAVKPASAWTLLERDIAAAIESAEKVAFERGAGVKRNG